MIPPEGRLEDFGDLGALRERAKELRCLYRVMGVLAREDDPLQEVVADLLAAIPPGWQYPEVTAARLTLEDGRRWDGTGFRETPWTLTSRVRSRGETAGSLEVVYLEERPSGDTGPFLEEERQLLETIAGQLGQYLARREPRADGRPGARSAPGDGNARVILDFLARTDARLTRWLTAKMLNHLRWRGVEGVEALLPPEELLDPERSAGSNRPISGESGPGVDVPTREVFELASRHCSQEEILRELRAWITQDKVRFLVSTVEDQGSSMDDIVAALERFESLGVEEQELPRAIQTMLRVGLLRRFFTEEIDFINTAKGVVKVGDFHALAACLVHPRRSHGRLGGKSAGVFLAKEILDAAPDPDGLLKGIRVPRTWHIGSDGVLAFVRHNNLEDVYDRKYLDVEEVRQQYRHVVQVFRNSRFPPELKAGLARALENLGRRPLIVRSSSLLEDRTGAAFSGKYKSLFLANQGSREQRLRELQTAVAEVYASIFGPDPIEYRAERNLLDVHEEMGIMIQEVVGTRVGDRYFLPAYSGVALSNN
ncbi:MAG TPA: PEP/pyruvate-binding domain-containing protein, partial [Longimicrobiales bacterium]|nr:PEP/pyruvate-binding domain-containing protein [Longimicrobiales bacterium]